MIYKETKESFARHIKKFGSVSIAKTTTVSNNTNATTGTTEPVNVTKVTNTSQNATAKVIKTDSFRTFKNKAAQPISSTQMIVNNRSGTGFALRSTNHDVSLVSISAIFGMLGRSVSAIVSV